MSSSRLSVRRNLVRILSTSICASAVVPLFAAASGDAAGPLPAGGARRPLFAANSVPPITGDPEPAQVLPAPAPVAKTDAAAMPKAGDPAAKEEPSLTKAAPSESVTINLINRLVERGVLTKEDAVGLIQQAEADAVAARAQTEVTQQIVNSVAPLLAIPPQAPPTADIAPYSGQSSVRVTYIPESVKAQMRDQIKAEVMAQARNERWADPRTVPEWTTRIRLFGDVRTRYEGLYYDDGNDNTGAFPNFNAINAGAPFDVSGTIFSPQLNVDQDRARVRLRARLGVEANLGEGFSIGLRLATGDSNSPVSTNQSFGLANAGQGGNFSKYAIWLDRGYLRYELAEKAPPQPPPPAPPDGKDSRAGSKEVAAPREFVQARDRKLVISLGRFDNPFYTPTDIVWDDDLNFDGVAANVHYQIVRCFTPFLSVGAFPYFNTNLNFATNRPDKFASTDKWLYAGQLGFDWKPHQDFKVKLAGGYYVFDRVVGKLSTPYTPLHAEDAGDTDNTRPAFAQKGNTYRPLRNIVPTADNNFGTTNQFQYFGLATPFRVLSIAGQIDYNRWEPFQITAFGEFAQNLAWDRNSIERIAINNRGAISVAGTPGLYEGGNTAWLAGLRVGHPLLAKRWDWNVGFNYRHVESDAVVDGFTDSTFAGGGTNVQGYTFFGRLALSANVALLLRWMSSNEIAGPPFSTDILQVDVGGKF